MNKNDTIYGFKRPPILIDGVSISDYSKTKYDILNEEFHIFFYGLDGTSRLKVLERINFFNGIMDKDNVGFCFKNSDGESIGYLKNPKLLRYGISGETVDRQKLEVVFGGKLIYKLGGDI
jgi:hypothetical protein